MGHEIITLQFGSYSNFVGTHFWNIQESSFNYDGTEGEINHDILFREGLTPNGDVTFTPRLVFVDLKQNLGSLSSQGKLYSETNNVFEIPTWDKHCEVIASERNVRNEFIEDLYLEDESYRNNSDCCKAKDKEYKLDGQIDYWSDFKRLHYHPRSALTIDACDPLGGVDPKVSFNVEEAVRFYAEECDTLQGFQFLCDASSCNLLSPTLEHLTQDYHGKGLHVYPVQPLHQRHSLSEIRTHDLSVLFSLSESIKNSSIVSPMSLNCDLFNKNNQKRDFPALLYNSSDYHTSAVLATVLDGLTQVTRQRKNLVSMSHIEQHLSSGEKNLATVGASIPFPYSSKYSCLPDMLCDYVDKDLWTTLTPSSGQLVGEYSSQFLSLSGFPSKYGVASTNHPEYNVSRIHQASDVNEVLKLYLEGKFGCTKSIISTRSSPMKTSTPFPNIFHPTLGPDGFPVLTDGSNQKDPEGISVDSIPLLTSASNSSSMLFKQCCTRSKQLLKWKHCFPSIENDILQDMNEELMTLLDKYQ